MQRFAQFLIESSPVSIRYYDFASKVYGAWVNPETNRMIKVRSMSHEPVAVEYLGACVTGEEYKEMYRQGWLRIINPDGGCAVIDGSKAAIQRFFRELVGLTNIPEVCPYAALEVYDYEGHYLHSSRFNFNKDAIAARATLRDLMT